MREPLAEPVRATPPSPGVHAGDVLRECMTFFIGRFPDEQAVESWCAEQFSDLSGAELANACAARRLRPPR
jgi:hypothetical protein